MQVVNGRGLSEATEAKNYETDNSKNVGVRFTQELGKARVGGFYYGGKQRADGRESSLLVLGPDATVPMGDKFELNLQYMYRRDANPFFLDSCAQGDVRCDYGGDESPPHRGGFLHGRADLLAGGRHGAVALHGSL